MNQRVMCAIDVDSPNEVLLDVACYFAKAFKVDIDLVFVSHVPELATANRTQLAPSPHSSSSSKIFPNEQAFRSLTVPDTNVMVHYHHLIGVPQERLLEFAEQTNPQMLIVGSHGRTGVQRLIMGSIAESLMRTVSSPLLVVRNSR